LAQIPDPYRHGTPILVRADGAGCSEQFLADVRSLRKHGTQTNFSVGFTTEAVKEGTDALPAWAWQPAIEADGELRGGAEVAELTGFLPDPARAAGPQGCG
jgi:hypothetical protein